MHLNISSKFSLLMIQIKCLLPCKCYMTNVFGLHQQGKTYFYTEASF